MATSLAPAPPLQEQRFAASLEHARQFGLLERACDAVLASTNHISGAIKSRLAKAAKRLARGLKRDAQKNATRSTLSFAVGSGVGFSLLTGSLLGLAAAKAFLPFVILAVFGVATLAVCLPAGYYFSVLKANQEHDAAILEEMAEDLAK